MEEIYTNWILYEYFHNIYKVKIDEFYPYLILKEVYCAGIDIITSKHIYKAAKASKKCFYLKNYQKIKQMASSCPVFSISELILKF